MYVPGVIENLRPVYINRQRTDGVGVEFELETILAISGVSSESTVQCARCSRISLSTAARGLSMLAAATKRE